MGIIVNDVINDLELAQIFQDTRALSHTTYASATSRLMYKNTTVYDENEVLLADDMMAYAAQRDGKPVRFITGGTVSTGYRYSKNGTTAILNFADAITPGGLVLTGGTTQEENICRCSNLYESITIDDCMREYYDANRMSPNGFGIYLDNIIYSTDVCVFRDDITYDYIRPRFMDVITCPAPSVYIKDDLALNIYINRIRRIVESAICNGVEYLILGAWGCGAFHQNPRLIAQAFVEVLNEYSGLFNEVVFAMRNTPGEPATGVTAIFLDEFNNGYEWGVSNGIR